MSKSKSLIDTQSKDTQSKDTKKLNPQELQQVSVVNNAEYERLEQAKRIIMECQNKSEGIAEQISKQLYLVHKDKLYKMDNYNSMGLWANEMFGISQGTCSDAIAVFKRFKNDVVDEIDSRYRDYTFSSLITLKKLSDEEIKKLEINPDMSRKKIKIIIKNYLEEKKKIKNAGKVSEELPTSKEQTAALEQVAAEEQTTGNDISPITIDMSTYHNGVTFNMEMFLADVKEQALLCLNNQQKTINIIYTKK